MDDIRFSDPCLLFALPRESKSFRKTFRPQQGFPNAPCWAKFCGPSWLTVLVMHVGVGKDRAKTAIDWLLSGPQMESVPYHPKTIVFAGYAGGLTADLEVGDVILANEIIDEQGVAWKTTWPGRLPTEDWHPPLHRGRILTTRKMISDPEQKRQLGQQHGAIAVDMETSVLAQRCTTSGVPFGCVRVVSDAVDTRLTPELVDVVGQGEVSIGKLLRLMLRRPSVVGSLMGLARSTKLAGRQLGMALGELMTLTLPWSNELDRSS